MSQDCCENVSIQDTEGEWHTIIGKVIIEADEEIIESNTSWGSRTDTKLKFRVDDATVISKWVGESNGYYSESVDIAEVARTASEEQTDEG